MSSKAFQFTTIVSLIVLLCLVFILFTNANRELNDLRDRVSSQDDTIQSLRNDVNDMDWYYDEYLRILEIEENAQDEMINRLFKYVLEEYDGELVESYVTHGELLGILELYYTKTQIRDILEDYSKVTFEDYASENNVFMDVNANEVIIAFYNSDMSDVIYVLFVIENNEIYLNVNYQGEILYEEIDTLYGTKEEFLLELKEEIVEDKIDFDKVYGWYVE